jgi:hypothetical protein
MTHLSLKAGVRVEQGEAVSLVVPLPHTGAPAAPTPLRTLVAQTMFSGAFRLYLLNICEPCLHYLFHNKINLTCYFDLTCLATMHSELAYLSLHEAEMKS